MHGFQYLRLNGVHWFTHSELKFTLKLQTNGQSSFCLTSGEGKIVSAPKPNVSILGEPYQPDFPGLGYDAMYYANAIHELIHIMYSWLTAKRLSPNHQMLLGLGDIPISQADSEEVIITGFQVYSNIGILPEKTKLAIEQDLSISGDSEPVFNWLASEIKDFHTWLEKSILA